MAGIAGLTYNSGPQGPSSLNSFGGSSPNALNPQQAFASGGLTYNSGPQQAPQQSGGGGGGQAPQQQSNTNQHINPSTGVWDDNYYNSHYGGAQQGVPGQPDYNAQFDAIIQPAIQGLQAQIQPLQEGYNNQITGIDQNQQQYTNQLNTNTQAQEGILSNSQTQQQNGAQNASDQARQQYAEIQQGLQARYGGTTGTGQFAGEIAGRGAMQNINQIQQGLQTSLADIATRKQQVDQSAQEALTGINQQHDQQAMQAKQQLDAQLADIRNQTGQLQSHKAELALNAMQMYQDTVSKIQAQNSAFRQNLVLQAQQAQSQLQVAEAYAQRYASGFSGQNFNASVPNPVGQPQAANQATGGPTGGYNFYGITNKNNSVNAGV